MIPGRSVCVLLRHVDISRCVDPTFQAFYPLFSGLLHRSARAFCRGDVLGRNDFGDLQRAPDQMDRADSQLRVSSQAFRSDRLTAGVRVPAVHRLGYRRLARSCRAGDDAVAGGLQTADRRYPEPLMRATLQICQRWEESC